MRYPKLEELKAVASIDKGDEGIAYLGDYAIGEEVIKEIQVKLSVGRFLRRRTAIFGQAGFGKSNLIKSVLAEIAYYGDDNALVIFDVDGEYSFRTEQSAGLADIKSIRGRITVFSHTERTEKEYADIYAGKPHLNLKDLSPYEVVESLFPASKQATNYATWLLSIKEQEIATKWHRLVDELNTHGLDTSLDTIISILGIQIGKQLTTELASASGLRTTLNRIIRSQHNADSSMLSKIEDAVLGKRVVIVDLSRMPLDTANGLIEIILNKLFKNNEERFVSGKETTPVLVMVEEAQNFLSSHALRGEGNIVIRIAKEGRKYGFGLIYVTQQPSAIDDSVLSQTNNFFVLHLLTQGDIKALVSNNPLYEPVAHYIQTEPIRGVAYFYSNVYSENGAIKPTTVVFSSMVRKFDDVVAELGSMEPRKKWEALEQDANRHREQLFELAVQVLDNTFHSGRSSITWAALWGEVNRLLPTDNPHKDGYEAKSSSNRFPAKSAIEAIEKRLLSGNDPISYRIQKDGNNYTIERKDWSA